MNLRFYATAEAAGGPDAIAQAFADAGYALRKCGWLEFEAESEWAELVIESSEPVLVHGLSAPGAFERVVAVLRAGGFPYRAEWYDGDRCVADEQWPSRVDAPERKP